MKNIFVFLSVLLLISGCSKISTKSSPQLEDSVLTDELGPAAIDEAKVPESSAAQYNFLRGELAINDGKLDEALSYFEKAANEDPEAAEAIRLRLVQLYVRFGRLEDALKQIDIALSSNPDDPQFLQLQAGILATLKKTDEAIAVYQKLISQKNASDDVYVLLASLYAQAGKLNEGIDVLNQLVKKNPNSVFGYYYMAKFYESWGKPKEAEENYKRALQLGGGEALILDYARFLGVNKRFREALQICDEILKKDAENLPAKKLKAQLLVAQNKLDEAITQFEEVGKQEEDPTETRLKIALIKVERQDFDGAILDLNLVLAKYPDNYQARYYLAAAYGAQRNIEASVSEIKKIPATAENYGQSRMYAIFLLQQEGQLERAADVVTEMLSVKPDNPRLYAMRASLHNERGAKHLAIADMKKATELDPKSDNFAFSLGVYYDQIGNKEDSVKYLEKTIALNPKHAAALNYLGYALVERKQQLERAVKLIEQAIALEPNSGYYIDSLGWAYYQMGKNKEALRELERAVKLVANDAVILEHFAIVKAQSGDIRGAIETAKKGLQFAPKSEDKGVEERLKQLIAEWEQKIRKVK